MSHLLYLMFRCDFNVMESLEELGETKHSPDLQNEQRNFISCHAQSDTLHDSLSADGWQRADKKLPTHPLWSASAILKSMNRAIQHQKIKSHTGTVY